MTTRPRSRFGKITEAKMDAWFGRDVVETMMSCSDGLHIPVPIMGVGAAAYKGCFIPRIAGGAGFTSLSDLINEATVNGKLQNMMYSKTSTIAASAAGASQDLWNVGALPQAGSNASAVPGGTIPTRATTGALGQQDPGGSDQLYMTTWTGVSTAIGSLLLFDRLAAFLTSEATASNAVTGTQTRYTGAASTSQYAAGVFCATRVTTVRAATTPTVTLTYTDQDGNASASSGAMTLRSAAAVGQTCFTPPQWTSLLASGDTGIQQLTHITYSTTSTGVTEFYLGYPIALLPQPAANMAFVLDGINSAFNLIQIQTGAALSFQEFFKPATAALTYTGQIVLVSG